MQRAYRFAIGYFALFGLLMLGSGAWLFFAKIGFAPDAVQLYYLGSDTIPRKSGYGLLETAVPHLGAMGLLIMVMAHFLLFAPKKAKRQAVILLITLFIAAATDIVSGAVVAAGGWVWVKLVAFGTLMMLGSYLSLLILYYAFWWWPQPHPR